MSSKSKRLSRQSTLKVSLRRNSEIVEAFSLFDKVRLEKEILNRIIVRIKFITYLKIVNRNRLDNEMPTGLYQAKSLLLVVLLNYSSLKL